MRTNPVLSFNFEAKINCGLHLFVALCGWMARGWFLNVRNLGVTLCATNKWSELSIWFNLICFNAIQGKHFLHAFDLPITCFVATLSISTCVSFVSLQKSNCICLTPLKTKICNCNICENMREATWEIILWA